jgi:hypothetical protein
LSSEQEPALEELRARLEAEQEAYGELLTALDALAAFPLPAETAAEAREKLQRLNALWAAPEPPASGGIAGALARRAWRALAPALERQTAFNAALVQLLNARLEESDRLHARLRELAAALVRYAQRVEPLVDARARIGTALATTRAELVLEAFGRQLESYERRIDALHSLGQRIAEKGPGGR